MRGPGVMASLPFIPDPGCDEVLVMPVDQGRGEDRLRGTIRGLVGPRGACRADRHDDQGNSDRDWSHGLAVEYPNDILQAQFIWRDIQANFRPALGFVQRRNVRMLRVGASYNPRPKELFGIQQMFNAIFYTRFTRLDNGLVESWDLFPTWLDWHFKSGDAIHRFFDPNPTYERLFAPFEISPGVVLPPGEYRFTRWRAHVTTAQKRKLSGSAKITFGSFWSGHANQIETTLTYKIPPRFTIAFNTNQTFARLPQGNFTARILSWQVNYTASPFLSLSNLIQYDNLSRNLGWQSRMRWTLKAGNDLFVVFNQGWIQDLTGGYNFHAQESKISTKFQYTFRF